MSSALCTEDAVAERQARWGRKWLKTEPEDRRFPEWQLAVGPAPARCVLGSVQTLGVRGAGRTLHCDSGVLASPVPTAAGTRGHRRGSFK